MLDPLHQGVSLKDTQNEPDHRQVDIDRVGVKALRFPIQIQDKHHRVQHTVATVALAVDLPSRFKGTHMSRFVEVLHLHGDCLTVSDMAAIPRELIGRLHAREAHVEFVFPFFISKPAPVSLKHGLIDYQVTFTVNANANALDFVVTVAVPVTTLCPCSKAISERGAHNQRGIVTFSTRFSRPVWIEDLIAMVEAAASCELYSILKRPDEKAVTERAYDNPVFVEDLVRNVAVAARTHPDITWFRVEAENFESIHNHNAYAMVEGC
jgi:GTP cyclohydrolase IB